MREEMDIVRVKQRTVRGEEVGALLIDAIVGLACLSIVTMGVLVSLVETQKLEFLERENAYVEGRLLDVIQELRTLTATQVRAKNGTSFAPSATSWATQPDPDEGTSVGPTFGDVQIEGLSITGPSFEFETFGEELGGAFGVHVTVTAPPGQSITSFEVFVDGGAPHNFAGGVHDAGTNRKRVGGPSTNEGATIGTTGGVHVTAQAEASGGGRTCESRHFGADVVGGDEPASVIARCDGFSAPSLFGSLTVVEVDPETLEPLESGTSRFFKVTAKAAWDGILDGRTKEIESYVYTASE